MTETTPSPKSERAAVEPHAIDSSPDALLVVDDHDGIIRYVNRGALELFGTDEAHLVGAPAARFLPGAIRTTRSRPAPSGGSDPVAPSAPFEWHGRRVDGSRFPVDITRAPRSFAGMPVVVLAVRDAGERRRSEVPAGAPSIGAEAAAFVRFVDAVLQYQTSALYSIEQGDIAQARQALLTGVAAARQLLTSLPDLGTNLPADPVDGPRGDGPSAATAAPVVAPPSKPITVVLVDDTDDLRDAMRRGLSRQPFIEIVGEAVDGAEGVEVVERVQPDVVLLDYSMPVLDGLAALRRIRVVAPAARVIMISGYGHERIGVTAIDLGAVAYLEKGTYSLKEVTQVICRQFPERTPAPTGGAAPTAPSRRIRPLPTS